MLPFIFSKDLLNDRLQGSRAYAGFLQQVGMLVNSMIALAIQHEPLMVASDQDGTANCTVKGK